MTESSRRRPTVAHVSSAHPYTDNRIHYRECQTLAEAGYDVTLIAVGTNVEGPPSAVRVLTIPKRSRVKRVLVSSTQVICMAIKSGAKIVHLHDPELIPFIPVLLLARRRVVYDAHEDLPLQMLTKPYLTPASGRVMALAAQVLNEFTRLAAHRIVAATDQTAARYRSNKTVVVHNYPPLRAEESNPPEKENVLVYVGTISKSRGVIKMLEATKCEEFPNNWELHLAGRAEAEALRAIEEIGSFSRVKYHGVLAPNKARDLLLRSKVGIVTFESTPWHRRLFPTKMFEYFAAGLPVIASDFPVWREIVEEGEAGVLVDESDPVAIARAVKFYDESPETYKNHSTNARRNALESRNWTAEGAALVDAYDSLLP